MTRITLLHGVGSSGAGMRPLASALGLTNDVHVPDGPEVIDMGPGRQWFSVKGITEENRPTGIAAATLGFGAVINGFGDPVIPPEGKHSGRFLP